jgi:hypothetical protein
VKGEEECESATIMTSMVIIRQAPRLNRLQSNRWTTYIYTYMHTYVRTYIHTYMPTYIHTYMTTYIYTYIHKHIHTYIHEYMNTLIHTLLPACVHAIRTLLNTCIHTCVCMPLALSFFLALVLHRLALNTHTLPPATGSTGNTCT